MKANPNLWIVWQTGEAEFAARADAERRANASARAKAKIAKGAKGANEKGTSSPTAAEVSGAFGRRLAGGDPSVVERRDDGDVPSEDSSSEYGALLRRYPRHPRLAVTAFVDDMAVAYGAADLAFARAGAVTCAELLATATPAVLVPSPNVAEDHQSVNAEAMARAGAATAMSEARMVADRDGATVEEVVGRLLSDDDGTLERMRRAAREADQPGGAEAIARDVARVALKTP